MHFINYLLFCFLLPLSHLYADGISHYQLDNGLKVALQANQNQSQIFIYTIIHTGSARDPKFKTGLSNLTFHMLLSTNTLQEPYSFRQTVEMLGGSEHSSSHYDYVLFNSITGTNTFSEALQLHSNLLQPISIDTSSLDQQKDYQAIVYSQTIENDVIGKMIEHNYAMSYLTSPYRTPVLGWKDDLAAIDPLDIYQWHQSWYQPNNATLLITGPIDLETTLSAVKEKFAAIESSPITKTTSTQIVASNSISNLTSFWATSPYILISYHVPSLKRNNLNDALAMLVTSKIISQSANDILPSLDTEKASIINLSSHYMIVNEHDSLFQILAHLKPNADPLNATQQIQDALDQIYYNSLTLQSINASKTYLSSEWNYINATPEELNRLTSYALAMDLEQVLLNDYMKHINAITPKDISESISKYLNTSNRSVTILTPSLSGKSNYKHIYG